ncbi:hypothetical protein GGS21DRAFT_532650, partial [Xylaria nigripes]
MRCLLDRSIHRPTQLSYQPILAPRLSSDNMVSWCSWLSRQSNTLKVSGSSPGEIRNLIPARHHHL